MCLWYGTVSSDGWQDDVPGVRDNERAFRQVVAVVDVVLYCGVGNRGGRDDVPSHQLLDEGIQVR